MKFNTIVLALALSSQTAFAYQCNTVMGGCPTDTGVVTSTHMRSDLGVTVAHPESPQQPLQKQVLLEAQVLLLSYLLKSNTQQKEKSPTS